MPEYELSILPSAQRILMRRILTNNLQKLSVAPRTPIPLGMRS